MCENSSQPQDQIEGQHDKHGGQDGMGWDGMAKSKSASELGGDYRDI